MQQADQERIKIYKTKLTMGNLDLTGWTGKEDEFKGLYAIGDDLQKNNQLKEQRAYRDQQNADRDEARRNSQSQFFTNFLNKKDHITGTAYDNNTSQLLGEALKQAYQQSSKGAQTADIMMSIQPLIDKVNTYDSKAKEYVQNRDKVLDFYGKQKGYNLPVIRDLLDKETFYKTDDKGQNALDVDNADPSLQRAIQSINDNHLHDITNGEGIGEWTKQQPADVREASVMTTDRHGNRTSHKLNVKAANWEVPEVEGNDYKFVPKYDVAKDNNIPIEHEGKEVRVLDDKVFNDFLSDNSNRDHVLGELRQALNANKQATGVDIPLHSPKAEITARAIAYKMLEGKTSGSVVTASKNTLSAPQIRLNFTGSPYAPRASSTGADVPVNEVYKSIQSDLAGMKSQGIDHLPVENMSNTTARDYVLAEANKGKTKTYQLKDLRVVSGDDGTTRVFDNKGNFLNYVNPIETDRAGNKSMGQKTQHKIVERGTQEATPKKDWNTYKVKK